MTGKIQFRVNRNAVKKEENHVLSFKTATGFIRQFYKGYKVFKPNQVTIFFDMENTTKPKEEPKKIDKAVFENTQAVKEKQLATHEIVKK